MAIQSITEQHLEALSIGAGVLGSGGGGNPRYDYLMARQAIKRHGPVRLLKLDTLADDDFIIPLCFMGAPLVCMEKLPTGDELRALVAHTERRFQKKVTALVPAEIGGGNAFVPFFIAGELGLPIVDADEMGRAFPELQMSSVHLLEPNSGPALLADEHGSVVTIDTPDTKRMETIGRAVTVSMGSVAALMLHAMTGKTAKEALIAGSISRAVEIGETILNARANKKDPITALVHAQNGAVLMQGMITDIDHAVNEGFLRGIVRVDGKISGELVYQNEYLLARVGGKVAAMTPDILIMLEQESGEPLTTDRLAHGLRVAMVVLPSPTLWTTKHGLDLVGPRAFGFDTDYEATWRQK